MKNPIKEFLASLQRDVENCEPSLDGYMALHHSLEDKLPKMLSAMQPKHYVLHIEGDVTPELVGPYKTEEKRDAKAKRMNEKMGDPKDGLFRLDVVGTAKVDSYYGDELGEEQ